MGSDQIKYNVLHSNRIHSIIKHSPVDNPAANILKDIEDAMKAVGVPDGFKIIFMEHPILPIATGALYLHPTDYQRIMEHFKNQTKTPKTP